MSKYSEKAQSSGVARMGNDLDPGELFGGIAVTSATRQHEGGAPIVPGL